MLHARQPLNQLKIWQFGGSDCPHVTHRDRLLPATKHPPSAYSFAKRARAALYLWKYSPADILSTTLFRPLLATTPACQIHR